jgi:hypothetical protein
MTLAIALQEIAPFRWSKKAELAALRLAEDELPDHEIASLAGISPRTLAYWKDHPEFRDRIQSNLAQLHAAMLRYPIAKRRYRIKRLNDLEAKAWDVIEARANDPELAGIPGGETGMIVRQIKIMGTGNNAREVEEYSYDKALSSDLQSLYDQAATETGQKVERIQAAVAMAVQLVGISPDDI